MKKRRIALSLLLLLCAAVCAALLLARPWERTGTADGAALALHVVDVGQGDALLLQSGGQFLLVDAGPRDGADALCAYLRAQGVDSLDIVLTHFHADHSGGLRAVLDGFSVGTLYVPDGADRAQILAYAGELAGSSDCALGLLSAGSTLALGEGALEVLSPQSDFAGEEENARSLVLLARCEGRAFLLTGDAPAPVLEGLDLPHCDVLKLAHHGSADGLSANLLDTLSPAHALVSCGADNSYGHPHARVLELLAQQGTTLWRTDRQGHLVAAVTGGELHILTTR